MLKGEKGGGTSKRVQAPFLFTLKGSFLRGFLWSLKHVVGYNYIWLLHFTTGEITCPYGLSHFSLESLGFACSSLAAPCLSPVAWLWLWCLDHHPPTPFSNFLRSPPFLALCWDHFDGCCRHGSWLSIGCKKERYSVLRVMAWTDARTAEAH